MNVLIDTNVILDDILDRAPNAELAKRINRYVTDEVIGGYLTANTLTDIFCIVSKNKNEVIARKTIKNLLLIFTVVSVDSEDCRKAIDLPMSDFEDALVVVCAEKANLEYIVTNDRSFLATGLNDLAIKPADFLLKI
jgi:predicted nucleic acid-binding protein